MKDRFLHLIVLNILLIFHFSACLAAKAPDPNESSKYLDAVREFADNVLKYGRDTYGPKHTPLFVDGLMVRDPNDPNYGKDGVFKPVEWISPEGERWILSNLASQQNLFRTLDGLTAITGDPKYKQAAMKAIKYAFENLRSPNGLLYWGGYAAYDALHDRHFGSDLHVFKGFLPYHELMWEVNPEATSQLIESLWATHVLNWSNLAMNRYGPLDRLSVPKGWEHEYEGGAVFFEFNGASFASTGSDLYYAAAILSKFSGKKEPLIWAKRLAYRYVETRDPKVGVSSSVYTLPTYRSKHPLADDFKGHKVHSGTIFPTAIEQILDPEVRKCKLGYFIVSPGIPCTSFPNRWICSLLVGELLGDESKEFTQWALEELTARGKIAYRKKDNVWIPMLLDGTSLEGYEYKKDEIFGPKGTVFKPISAEPIDLWGYALAYRLTSNAFIWDMTRCIAQGNGLGDIGAIAEDKPKLQIPSNHFDPYTLLAFLELYSKTGVTAFLKAAQEVGDNILTIRFNKGFFVPSDKHIYTKFDAIEALVLLNLDATIRQKSSLVPQVWPGRPLFNQPFRDKELVVDNALIYTLTETSMPPRSLQEAAACGDIDEVKSLIAQGADVNSIESLLLYTPLYHAVLKGHKEVVTLLLEEGALVDARDAFPCGTPLDYAAEKGYKEIVKILIAHGANVNAARRGYPNGDTPLHSAVRAGHKEIVDLLISKKADVNAKNKAGQTPLYLAVRQSSKDIIELLIADGADINAKNNKGQMPLDIAVNQNHREIVRLLVAKGADISFHAAARFGDLAIVENIIQDGTDLNAKDALGKTPLHHAVEYGHKKVVELLIAKDANINIKDDDGNTPGHIALGENKRSILELLIAKGVNVISIHLSAYQGDLDKVRDYIEKGTDVNTVDSFGATPLHYAALCGSKEVVEFLIASGADINAKKKSGDTPLHWAAISGSKDVVELLVDNGANINAKGQWDYTPMFYAAWSGIIEVVELLVEKGADINAKDKWGWTPLHYMTDKDNGYMAEFLIAKGADVNAKDKWGVTPLEVAKDKGHTKIVDLLRKHGAKEDKELSSTPE